MELEITIEAANPLKHDLLAALAGLVPRQRITVVGTETDSNRIRLSFTVAARSPDILLQEIGAVVARFENASPGEEVLDIRVRNTACSEPPIDTIQPGGFFSPVAGLRILSGNSGADILVPATEDILLEPSQAFGTGLHPSTKLCLSLLKQVAELDPQNRLAPYSVLDIGCGSGILTIAALRFGATRVLGIEIDPDVVEIARRNLHINHLDHAAGIMHTSCLHVPGQYDLVLANLVPSVLFKGARHITELLNNPGFLITAGFPAAGSMKFARLFAENGLHLQHQSVADGWGALLLASQPSVSGTVYC